MTHLRILLQTQHPAIPCRVAQKRRAYKAQNASVSGSDRLQVQTGMQARNKASEKTRRPQRNGSSSRPQGDEGRSKNKGKLGPKSASAHDQRDFILPRSWAEPYPNIRSPRPDTQRASPTAPQPGRPGSVRQLAAITHKGPACGPAPFH